MQKHNKPGIFICLLIMISYCLIIIPTDKWTILMIQTILFGLISLGAGFIFGFLYSLLAFAGFVYVLRYLAFRKNSSGRKNILTGIVLLCIHRLIYFVVSDSVGRYVSNVLLMIPEIVFWISVVVALVGIFKRRPERELNT